MLPIVLLLACPSIFTGCKGRSPELEDPERAMYHVESPLSNFSDSIRSPIHEISARAGEVLAIPVTVTNETPQQWSSHGKYPIDASYKWISNGKILPIEGERTHLPVTLSPGHSLQMSVNVVVPDSGSNLVLRVSLVQEGVSWFYEAGASTVDIPVNLHE